MNRQHQDLYLLIQNDDGTLIKSELDKLQKQTAIYIESKYQDAIFSADNFIPIGHTQKLDQLRRQLESVEYQQADLIIQIDGMKKEKESLINTIKSFKISKQMIQPVLTNSNQPKKIEEIKKTEVQIKNTGLDSAIQKKAQLDRKTALRLQKLIRKEEIKIANWKAKIQEMKQKMAYDEEKKRQIERNMRENSQTASRKLAEDHRTNLQQSIRRLSQYIRSNSEILPFIE